MHASNWKKASTSVEKHKNNIINVIGNKFTLSMVLDGEN